MSKYQALSHKLKIIKQAVQEQLEARRPHTLPFVCLDFDTGEDWPGYEEHNDEARKHKFCKEYGFDVAEIGTEP